MDTPSKERLVGAIILVVLIVLLVPEILSGPRHAVPAAGSTPNTATRTYTIELGNPVKPPATAARDAKPPALPPPAETAKAVLPAAGTPPLEKPASATTAEAPAAPAPSPVAARPAPGAALAPASKAAWGAQLGSFSRAENAERLATSLRAKGYRAFVSPTGTGSHVLHRVRVGPEPSREAAEALTKRLKRDGQSATVIALP
jgi:DedD protein